MSAGRGKAVAALVTVLLHAAAIFLLLRASHSLLRFAEPAGGSLHVTLVAMTPRPAPVASPSRPVPPAVHKPRPVLVGHRLGARQIAVPAPVRTPIAMPTPPEPAAPPTSPPAAVLAPTRAALNLPSPQIVKNVAHVSCDIPQPLYPPRARRLGHEGNVMLRITIDPAGRVIEADVAQRSGFDELDAVARTAMLAGHCEPYVNDGTAMTVRAEQRVSFSLN